MYSNTVSLCVHHKLTQILKNKQVSRLIEKDAKSRKWREGKLNEGSQKLQCFSNKINKDKSCNVQLINIIKYHCFMLYMKVIDSKS